jgi:hypothetical protein
MKHVLLADRHMDEPEAHALGAGTAVVFSHRKLDDLTFVALRPGAA